MLGKLWSFLRFRPRLARPGFSFGSCNGRSATLILQVQLRQRLPWLWTELRFGFGPLFRHKCSRCLHNVSVPPGEAKHKSCVILVFWYCYWNNIALSPGDFVMKGPLQIMGALTGLT